MNIHIFIVLLTVSDNALSDLYPVNLIRKSFDEFRITNFKQIKIFIYPTPPYKGDVIQGQLLSRV